MSKPKPLSTQPDTAVFPYDDDHHLLVPHRIVDRPPRLGALESFIVARVDGRNCVADLAVLAALSAREVLHVLVGLSQLGVIDIAPACSARSGMRRRRLRIDELLHDQLGEIPSERGARDSQPRATLPVAGLTRK